MASPTAEPSPEPERPSRPGEPEPQQAGLSSAPGRGPTMVGSVVIVTAERKATELAAALQRRGATVRHAAVLAMIPHVGDEELLARTRGLIAQPPDVVVVTTGIGLRGWLEAAEAAGLVGDLLGVLSRARLVARGPKARGALQAAGLAADWVAQSETSEEIRATLIARGVAGQRIAIQHHGAGDDGLSSAFREAGAEVEDLVVYRWGPPADPDAVRAAVLAAAAGEADAVVFTSAPGAAAWLEVTREQHVLDTMAGQVRTGRLTLACVGPVTAAPLHAAGLDTLVPDRFRLGALIRELDTRFEGGATTAGAPAPQSPE